MDSGSIRVLHVDDEPDFADLAATYLEREDERFDVETATSAAEGLDRLADDEYDCVVSDYDMPQTNGIEFLEHVREDDPDLPFILFTGKGSEEVASEAIHAGVTDYLQKGRGTSQYELLAVRIANAVESHRAERRARLTEREYRDLFEQAPLMYVLARDQDGRPVIEDCNEQFLDTLDYERKDVIERPTTDFFSEESTKNVYEGGGYEAALHGEFGTRERTLVTSDGEHVHVLLRASPRLDANGNVVGLQTIYLDITDQKRREQQLRTERDRLAALFEDAPQPIVEGELRNGGDEYLIVKGNDAFEATFGYDTAEIVGRDIADVLVPAEERAEHERFRERVADGESFATEAERTTADGDRTFLLDITPYGTDTLPADGWFVQYTDVTDRRQREEELELYETMLETVPDGMYALDENFEYITVNQGMADLTGYSKDELIGDHLSLVNDEEVVRKSKRWRERIVADGIDDTIMTVEHPHITAGGEAIPTEARFRALPPDEDGQFRGTVGVVRDITERKEHERELEEYREYTDRILDAIDDVFFVIDEAGTLQRWNESLVKVTGYADEELASMHALDFVPESYSDRGTAAMKEVFETGHGRLKTPLLTKDGDEIPYEYVADRVEHPDGELRLVGIGRDISERKERERELERYETIVETVPDGVYALDENLEFILVNQGLADLTGYSTDELIDNHLSLVNDELGIESAKRNREQLLGDDGNITTDVITLEHKLLTAEGEEIECEARFRALSPDDEGKFRGTAGVVRDTSEQKRRERELERQNERLEQFASVVSHDLRNPLRIAEGNIKLASEECDSEQLDTAAEAIDRMDALIDDLLTLAREGEAVREPEPVAFADIVDGCWKTVQTADARLSIETDATIYANRSRLAQLLENLIRNAIEHGGDDVTVTVGNLSDGTGFYVEDDGPGIPADKREQIFERGYSTGEEGTGFGLAIVAEIADAHSWEITVTESDAGGTRFEITGVERA